MTLTLCRSCGQWAPEGACGCGGRRRRRGGAVGLVTLGLVLAGAASCDSSADTETIEPPYGLPATDTDTDTDTDTEETDHTETTEES